MNEKYTTGSIINLNDFSNLSVSNSVEDDITIIASELKVRNVFVDTPNEL